MPHFPPKKILVPFDFSEPSQAAARLACDWAKRFDADLEALYVEPSTRDAAWDVQAFSPQRRREMGAKLRSAFGPGARVRAAAGDAVTLILKAASEGKADLIVMGSHGRRGVSRFVYGSISEAVVRQSKIPVLAAHAGSRGPRAVLAPCNLTDYAEAGVAYAAEVAAALDKPLKVLHVADDEASRRAAEPKMRELLARLPKAVREACRASLELQAGVPTEEIVLAGDDAGLIVIVAHRKTILKDVALGTTAERVLRFSSAPVLAVPAPRRA